MTEGVEGDETVELAVPPLAALPPSSLPRRMPEAAQVPRHPARGPARSGGFGFALLALLAVGASGVSIGMTLDGNPSSFAGAASAALNVLLVLTALPAVFFYRQRR